MKYALVIIDAPVTDGSSLQQLANFVRDVESVEAKIIKDGMLNIGCFLLPLDNGANALGSFVWLAKDRRIPHRILFFEDKPSFVVTKV